MNDERDADAFGEGVGMGVRASGRRRTVRSPLHVATKASLHGLRVVYCTPHPARPPKDFLSFDLVGNHSHILGIPVRNSFVRAPEISLAICPPSLLSSSSSSSY